VRELGVGIEVLHPLGWPVEPFHRVVELLVEGAPQALIADWRRSPGRWSRE
jgi:hypothetical protein